VVLCYNSRQPKKLDEAYAALFAQTEARIELVYASEALRSTSKLEGIVEDSIIDVASFRRKAPRTWSGRFSVGRFSRDLPQKHHPSDPAFYARLVKAGCRVTIMGGMSLAGSAGLVPQVSLLPAGAMPPPAFLGMLDCFFYRIAPASFEAAGRVVTEAMAAELPVVCYRGGGYAEYIEDGRTGFLFETDDEAFERIMALAGSAELAGRVGKAARQSMQERFSPAAIEAILGTYLHE
jgi:glycosyltransferase involved in cell wall biosynthesis